jgi:hypothetical protein
MEIQALVARYYDRGSCAGAAGIRGWMSQEYEG